ncbi:hypothetical protein EWE75_21425 [Sphingomonas populi]|uniref:Polysaccharide pyruvyl transferase domain-containing protein n=1 Tax=Sphingomonas populi TaxID=2484750 RepID=A0A4Q6XLA7_9SPHN|nr:polysaccharide pyruvyl transferase family protein [Sphingomonas populi]RZF60733.1 hypothetical protein EWE75_21425 [Sphingomonas populi]
MKFLFVGHEDFGNRGCEALIRSISGILVDHARETSLLCPSKNPERDSIQWPDAKQCNVRFVAPSVFPATVRWWGRLTRRFSAIRKVWSRPRFTPDQSTLAALNDADAVIVTGGDLLGLEYGLESLYHWMGVADYAIDQGKPVHLWAASVGPFTADKIVEAQMPGHLARYASVSVRETASRDYLKSIGFHNVTLVTDPAFTMKPQPHNNADALFAATSDGVLGFNISPLVRGFLSDDVAKQQFDGEIVAFLRQVLDNTKLSVLLIPHVDPFDGSAWNSDGIYMKGLVEAAGGPHERLDILPSTLNAAQLKYTLGRCRFFMGARTHATIGALSLGVPTISIAYSIKARGINRDLFGNEDCVLPTRKVSQQSLNNSLDYLFVHEEQMRKLLAERIPLWRRNARSTANLVLG